MPGIWAVYLLIGPLRGARLARIVAVILGAMPRRARGWRRAIMLAGVLALAIAPCACTASGRPGGHASRPARATAAASPQHRRSGSPSVQLAVEASGDLLIHSAVFDRARVLGGGRHYDFAPMFTQIKPYIQGAELALCHVETPMTPAPPTGYPTFNTPPALAAAIAQTGWRACSTAGTHSLDQGQTGVDDTIRALDHAGVAHAGTSSSAAAQHTPLIMTVKGVRVAFLAYTEQTNGIPSPRPWSVNRASAAQILSDAHRAHTDGAKVVIVNIHWGDQYVARPSSFQLALAGTLTRSPDITAVIGQHVHIVQPIRIINGKLVVFGEGNLISNQTTACCPAAARDGMIVLLTITVDSRGARVTFIRYVPIWVRHPDFVVLPAGTAWRTDPADAAALRASYERTVAAAGRGPLIQPIPAHLLSAARPAPRITSQRTGRQRKRIAPGVGGRPRWGWGRRLVTGRHRTGRSGRSFAAGCERPVMWMSRLTPARRDLKNGFSADPVRPLEHAKFPSPARSHPILANLAKRNGDQLTGPVETWVRRTRRRPGALGGCLARADDRAKIGQRAAAQDLAGVPGSAITAAASGLFTVILRDCLPLDWFEVRSRPAVWRA